MSQRMHAGFASTSSSPVPRAGPPGGPLFGTARRPQNHQGKRRTSTVLVHLLPWSFWARQPAPKSGPESGPIFVSQIGSSRRPLQRWAGGCVLAGVPVKEHGCRAGGARRPLRTRSLSPGRRRVHRTVSSPWVNTTCTGIARRPALHTETDTHTHTHSLSDAHTHTLKQMQTLVSPCLCSLRGSV